MGKKLVIVTRSMFAGGAERVIAQLANYCVDKEIDCVLITIDNEKILYELDSRIKNIPIGKKAEGRVLDKYRRYKELRIAIKELNPDIVLSMPEDIGVYVILALLSTKIPVIVSERNNPWVMPNVKVTRILRSMMYPFAKGIIFQTEMAKSYFPRSIQKKGIVLRNPINAERIPLPYQGEREKVIVAAGRLDSQKNFPLLINAFAEFVKKHSDYKLCIYGEGSKRCELESLIKNLDIADKAFLPGRKNDLLELMNKAAMFVLSSDYEGMPNVLIEAMCMGMPVISTDCPSGGPRELIDNGINGVLIPVNNLERMVEAMNYVSDYKVAFKLGQEAVKSREYLTDEKVFLQWIQYLEL